MEKSFEEVLVQYYVDQYRENAKRSTSWHIIFTGSIVKQNQLNMRDFQKTRLWHLTSCIRK